MYLFEFKSLFSMFSYNNIYIQSLCLYLSNYPFVFLCYRWAVFRQEISSVTAAIDKVVAGHENVKVQLHIGGACYVSITSGIKCVDMRKFYRPCGAKSDDEIKPTWKGVALRFEEWAHMCSLVDTINTDYPSLADGQPCDYGDDHMNQIGYLECLECNPFLDQPFTADGKRSV